ncbi:MAG: hypothetical protein GY820_42565 [Gammaproteobacteria bacterium]|nr:hypothetical protein [Gammaproteobacteria bacterium]
MKARRRRVSLSFLLVGFGRSPLPEGVGDHPALSVPRSGRIPRRDVCFDTNRRMNPVYADRTAPGRYSARLQLFSFCFFFARRPKPEARKTSLPCMDCRVEMNRLLSGLIDDIRAGYEIPCPAFFQRCLFMISLRRETLSIIMGETFLISATGWYMKKGEKRGVELDICN